MYITHERKRDGNIINVPMPKTRGHMPPGSRVFKDKRRQPKVKQRANLRKELA